MAARKKKAAAKSLAKKDAKGGAIAAYDYGEMAGAGFDQMTVADFTIPYISIIQGLSDELKPSHGSYIEAAKMGMIINTVTKELIDPDKGLVFVPVDTSHQFVEWVPRDKGGGYVGSFAPDDSVVAHAKASCDFGQYKVDDNDLVETFYIYGFVLSEKDNFDNPQPVTIACTGTKIKPYKAMTTRLRAVEGSPPLFAHQLRVRSVPESNTKGDYYNFSFGPAGEDTQDSLIVPTEDGLTFLQACMEMQKQVRTGAIRPDHASVTGTDDDSDPSGGNF